VRLFCFVSAVRNHATAKAACLQSHPAVCHDYETQAAARTAKRSLQTTLDAGKEPLR